MEPGTVAKRHIVGASDVVKKREIAHRHIGGAAYIVPKRFVAERVVALHGRIGKRFETNGCAKATELRRTERLEAYGGVGAGEGVLV